MKKTLFTFLSADKQTEINMVEWAPEGEKKAVLQIAHGVTEYIDRYEELAEFLTSKGIVVVGNDHLGHGYSIHPIGYKMYFGPKGSWNYAVSDMMTVYNLAKRRYPKVPYVLMGFSMGSFLARTLLIDYPEAMDGAIIMGTGQTSSIEIAMGKFMAKQEAKKFGEENTSEGIKKLTFGTYNKKFAPNKTDFDWLCSNEKALKEYSKDPLIGGPMSAGLFREMLSGMKYTGDKDNVKKMNKNIPVLLISGEDDPVGGTKGVKKVYKSFCNAGMQNVTFKTYPNLRHDILHEKNKADVYSELYSWIEKIFM